MTNGEDSLEFYYDTGRPIGFYYDGEMYYYVFNLQGDIIAIVDDHSNLQVRYYYDVEVANYHGYRVFGKKPFKYTKTTTYIFCEQGIFVGFSSYTDTYLAERYKNHP
ncbi:MAG: hypothetical protein E7385_07500 [Ruminococcaceae bacterium]|nr:hypothetical protein [Oscillospiraceae bacterium]